MSMQPLETKLLSLLEQSKRPINRRTIADKLNLHGNERKQLTRLLERMVDRGRVSERKGFYRLPPKAKLVAGTFSQAERGYGFLRPDDAESDDLFIPARSVGSAMDGDRVEVSCHFSPRQGKKYAQIHRIIERAHSTLIGHFQARRGRAEVWPLNRSLGGAVQVKADKKIANGDVVTVEIEHYAVKAAYAEQQRPARGRIIEHLGSSSDPRIDIETVIRQHELPHQFSEEMLDLAQQLAIAPDEKAFEGRKDLRDLPLVTIDGESARDFDDAVALKKETGNRYRLWVCIADVAHYVTTGSLIDQEALERGTSVYFPGFCLPMLPEALSNGICSLNPHEDRLVMCAEMLIDDHGVTLESNFYPAVMHSQARLTYTQVAACLDNPQRSELTTQLQQQLEEMAELSAILTAMRLQRGCLNLDLAEVEIVLDDDGQPVDLRKIERNRAHRLIEEFMLAANEAVAQFLTQKEKPLLYRIHEQPDVVKLQDLQQLAAQCGIGMVIGKNLQRTLQELIDAVEDKPEGRMIRQQLLRSLQQARYAPENHGHFGLAAEYYCHFTSPIRRYPDLLIHRALKQVLDPSTDDKAPGGKKLIGLGSDCSDKERRAMQAERDLTELRRCQIMLGHIGHSYQGTIISVTDFGFFVELDDIYIDGLVHIRNLNDYFNFDPTTMTLTGERRRQSFKAGLRVEIKVRTVEVWRRRIDFDLIKILN